MVRSRAADMTQRAPNNQSLPRLVAALGALTAACESSPVASVPCQQYAAPGITAAVYDAATRLSLEDALVTASDGAFLDSARVTAFSPFVSLAYERAGTYSVSASASGYETFVTQRVVMRDQCHVITQGLSFYLAPDGGP